MTVFGGTFRNTPRSVHGKAMSGGQNRLPGKALYYLKQGQSSSYWPGKTGFASKTWLAMPTTLPKNGPEREPKNRLKTLFENN